MDRMYGEALCVVKYCMRAVCRMLPAAARKDAGTVCPSSTSMKRPLRWLVRLLGGLVALVLVGAGAAYTIGSRAVGRTHAVRPAALHIPSDSASVAHGAHLAAAFGCAECHTADLGGRVFIETPVGRVVASNLTRGAGGIGAQYSDADWDRSIRHGVKPSGRSVFIMPASGFHHLADADAAALIAFLKQLPPVDRTLPQTEVSASGRILAAGPLDVALEVDTSAARTRTAPTGPTAEHGAYLAAVMCSHCHGADLHGDQPGDPDSPYAPDLVAAGAWTLPQFARALHTGVRPAGLPLDARFMPWQSTRHMTDDEIAGLHAYLGTLRPRS